MKPGTTTEYLDVTRQDLKDAAELLGECGHLELSLHVTAELRRAEKWDQGDFLGLRAAIAILAGASLLVREYAIQHELPDVLEVLDRHWDTSAVAG